MSLDEDNCQKANPNQTLRFQSQQYQLNSKKHHQYQPLCKEREAEQLANGKKKFYYQLNSKKHHHYQPDLKMYEAPFAKPREVKAPEVASQGWNLPPALQQKWVRDKDSGCLTKVKDITMELKRLPADLNGHKEPEKTNIPAKEDAPQLPNGVSSSKLKIVKNKNKNGRIVIVMSKYMENGMQAARIKNGDSETADKLLPENDSSMENHLEKMKLVKKLGLMNGFAKSPKVKPNVPHTAYNIHCPMEKEHSPKMEQTVTEQDKHVEVRGQKQLPMDQPLQLTTKSNLVSGPLDRGVPSPVEHRETQSGFSALKRHLSDNEDWRASKRFLSSRSISAPNTLTSPPQSISIDQNGHQSQHGHQDYNYAEQEEPIDLSFVKPQVETAIPTTTQAQTQTQTQVETQTHAEEEKTEELSASNTKQRKEEPFPFKPFLGNIIITDITTNCLTVTFKEYVTV